MTTAVRIADSAVDGQRELSPDAMAVRTVSTKAEWTGLGGASLKVSPPPPIERSSIVSPFFTCGKYNLEERPG